MAESVLGLTNLEEKQPVEAVAVFQGAYAQVCRSLGINSPQAAHLLPNVGLDAVIFLSVTC